MQGLSANLKEANETIKSKIKYNQKLANIYQSYMDYFDSSNIDTNVFDEEYSFEKTKVSVKRCGLSGNLALDDLNAFYNTNKCSKNLEVSSVSSKSKKAEKTEIILHPLEIMNLYKALIDSQDQVVLVDIFARKDGEILAQDLSKNLADVHSIVLYKAADKICVIDPSKTSHSKHITSSTKFLSSENITIVVPKDEIEIYVPQAGNTGSKTNQYRDCVDIAVKIALGLIEGKEVINPDNLNSSIKSLKVVQQVTNQKDFNEHLFFNKAIAIARVRQATDLDIRDKAGKLLSSFDDLIKKSQTKQMELTQNAVMMFNKEYVHTEYTKCIAELFQVYKISNTLYIEELNQCHKELAGELGVEYEK